MSRYWFISFIEGGVVMLAELCAAKMMAPYFGTSVQVWAATLAVTLGGLTTGYLYGAYQASKPKEQNISYLKNVLFGSGVFIVLIPMFAHKLLPIFLPFSLEFGCLMSLMIILFPTLAALGSTSPIIINLLDDNSRKAGNTAGTVYAVSTLGGILFTLLTGFYLLPYLGIKFSLIFGGLCIASVSFLVSNIKLKPNLAMAGIIIMSAFCSYAFKMNYNPNFKVLYESDGLLGNIKVVEHSAENFSDKNLIGRGLVVNNTLQSFMDINDPSHSSIWAWSNIIPAVLSAYRDEKPKVLLCGLGGATIVKQLQMLGYDYEVVELDSRIHDIAKQYFYLGNSSKVTIDDARHFIRTTTNKYDIVIFDTFLSESAPEHLLTKESFDDVKNILNDNGMILSNFYGFTTGDLGYAARSVVKTYMNAGFVTNVIATPGSEEGRNLLLIGTKGKNIDFTNVNYEESDGVKITNLTGLIIPINTLDINDAEILTDNNPKLSLLYAESARSWKKGYNNIYTKNLYK